MLAGRPELAANVRFKNGQYRRISNADASKQVRYDDKGNFIPYDSLLDPKKSSAPTPVVGAITGDRGWVKGDGHAKALNIAGAKAVLAAIKLQKAGKLNADYKKLATARDALTGEQVRLTDDLLKLDTAYKAGTPAYEAAKARYTNAAERLKQEDARLDAEQKRLDAEQVALAKDQAEYDEKVQEANGMLSSKTSSIYKSAVKKVGSDTDIDALRTIIVEKLIDDETQLLTVPTRAKQYSAEEAALQSSKASRAALENEMDTARQSLLATSVTLNPTTLLLSNQ